MFPLSEGAQAVVRAQGEHANRVGLEHGAGGALSEGRKLQMDY
jgi:hypothetical protein